MTQLLEEDVIKVVSSLPEEIVEVLKTLRVYLGGGFIRSVLNREDPKDIDLFISESIDARLGSALLRDSRGYSVYTSNNAITLQKKGCKQVQFITRWSYSNAQEMIDSFDFTIAMAGIWYDLVEQRWKSVRHVNYYYDVYNRELVYQQPKRIEERAGSLLRLVKFIKRGYSVSDDVLAKVVARAASVRDLGESAVAGIVSIHIDQVRVKSKGGSSGIYEC